MTNCLNDNDLPSAWMTERATMLCQAIATLPPDSTDEAVVEALEPIVADIMGLLSGRNPEDIFGVDSYGSPVVPGDDDDVTPIMVACDKKQISCLKYIHRKVEQSAASRVLEAIMGHPLDRCSETCGGNAAAHFAASSGFSDGTDILAAMLQTSGISERKTSEISGTTACDNVMTGQAFQDNLISVLSQRNQHGDTPIMMASVAGHEHIMHHWLQKLILRRRDVKAAPPLLEQFREVLLLQNYSKDTALSLACGFGHHSVVDFLINPRTGGIISEKELFLHQEVKEVGLIPVDFNDIERCKQVLVKVESTMVLSKKTGADNLACIKERSCNIRRCLIMLQVRAEKIAQEHMDELLGSESRLVGGIKKESFSGHAVLGAHKKNQRSRKKEKIEALGMKISNTSHEHHGRQPPDVINQVNKGDKLGKDKSGLIPHSKDAMLFSRNAKRNDNDLLAIELPHVATLSDGSVVPIENDEKRLTGNHCLIDTGTSPSFETSKTASLPTSLKPINDMLRERCRYHSPHLRPGRTTHPATIEDELDRNVEAAMESLCLDASMLLLSPHGMAMRLSPSQLDVIEKVLKDQLCALEAARRIQGRLLSQASQTSES